MRHGLWKVLGILAVLGCGVACEDDPDDLEYLRSVNAGTSGNADNAGNGGGGGADADAG